MSDSAFQKWKDQSLAEWKAFQSAFPIEKLAQLKIDDYVFESSNDSYKNSFCHWLETETKTFCRTYGNHPEKYGIAYNEKTKKYLTKKDENIGLLFKSIIQYIVKIANTASSGNQSELYDLINDRKKYGFSPQTFWKIALLYQSIEHPFLAPVCGFKKIWAILEKKSYDGVQCQKKFQDFEKEKTDYWERSWDFLAPLRNSSSATDDTDDTDDDSDVGSDNSSEKWEYAEIIDLLKSRKNVILQGAPGTGKTFLIPYLVTVLCGTITENELLVQSADDLENIHKKVMSAYKTLVEQKQVVFTTFHPSMDYEDFIEGWRPDTNGGMEQPSSIKLSIQPGIFKQLCNAASSQTSEIKGLLLDTNRNVWKVFVKDPSSRQDCLLNNCIRIGFDDFSEAPTDEELEQDKSLSYFTKEMSIGDIVLLADSNYSFEAIGIITGNYEWAPTKGVYPRRRQVKWIYKGEPIDITSVNSGKSFNRPTIRAVPKIEPEKLLQKVEQEELKKFQQNVDQLTVAKPYILVIDEFNRGNISKIFGELITLIEADKRTGMNNSLSATLPYSKERFSVPQNVYIIGTMNTADRSISNIDYALRRRFAFVSLLPKVINSPSFNRELFLEISKLFVVVDKESKTPRHNDEYLSAEYEPEDVWLGSSYFLNLSDGSNIKYRYKYEIKPILSEYLHDGILKDSAREKIEEIERKFINEDY